MTSSGPSPVRGFIAAILHPLPPELHRAPLQGHGPYRRCARQYPGAGGGTGQPQSFLSVALLSRVPNQNGNDRPSWPPQMRAQRPFRGAFRRLRRRVAPGGPRPALRSRPRRGGTVAPFQEGNRVSEGAGQPSRAARRLFIDLTPLRRSRDFRRLVTGELVSALGTQLTTVAVPYQVYQLTGSSLVVGLVSITQLAPLIAGSLLGGSVVDAMDRRRVLMLAQVLMAACSAGRRSTPTWAFAVAVVRAAGGGGRVERAGQHRAQCHRAQHGPPVRSVHRERHIPGPVPARPGGGPRAGRAAAGRGGRPLRVLDGRGQLRGRAACGVPDLAAAGRGGLRPAGPALDPRGPQLRASWQGNQGAS